MGCQRVIAQTILDEKAEYVLALKGNQTALHEDVALFVAEQKERNFHECQISQNTTVAGDNGRIETRATTVIHNLDSLPKIGRASVCTSVTYAHLVCCLLL